METSAKTRKIGGSLIITIPKHIVDEEGLMEGEMVKIRKDGFGILKYLLPSQRKIR